MLRLLKADPRERKPANFSVKNEAEGEAHVYLYDVIGEDWFGGITAKDFAAQVLALDAQTIHLHINSPGGDVFEGRAMVAALKACKAKTIAHIDGLAASAASWLALACDEVEITKGAFVMIHNSWSFAYGNAEDFRTQADLLEKIDGTILDDYEAATGKDRDTLKAWMDAETWFTADEAVEHGFADRLAPEKATEPDNAWNLAAYKHAPKALTERPANASPEPDQEHEARERAVRLIEMGC
jgi:ATP-dependent Clp protease protease subunit